MKLEMIHTQLHNNTYLQQIIQINSENHEWYTVIELFISEKRENLLCLIFISKKLVVCLIDRGELGGMNDISVHPDFPICLLARQWS